MRTATALIAGLAMAGLVTPVSLADFVGLAVVLESASQTTAAGPRDVYRVFAEFTSPTDRVNSWHATAESPISIQNVLADGSTLGTGFTNFGGAAGIFAPKILGTPRDWDTFVTLGVLFGDEVPGGGGGSAIGFSSFITGNSFIDSDAQVLVQPTAPEGDAAFRDIGNDTELRVVLMQLTVQVGEHVQGTINLSGVANSAPYDASGQSFNSVPAPGALTFLLMTLAQFRGGRQRMME